MIHHLSIENFFSIADKQELNLRIAKNSPDLPCFIPSNSVKDVRIPTVVGIFGSNASGKSTVLRGIVSTFMLMMNSFDLQSDDLAMLFQPYRQNAWMKKPTIITLEFDSSLDTNTDFVKFKYELHISHQEYSYLKKIVSYESLSYAPHGKFRNLFKRNNQTIDFGNDFRISDNDPRKETIRPNASIISTLAKFNHQPSMHLCQLIEAIKTNYVGFEKNINQPSQFLTDYANDATRLAKLNKELRRVDVGLEEMSIEKNNQGLFVTSKHTGLDLPIALIEESSGTRRFIEIFLLLHYALESGSIAIIDEIDSDLHPLLLPELLRWFSDINRNPHGAQLFFTAHNPALLEVLEKEQVFFTEKICGKSTTVFAASDIQGLRREPSLMKKYLAGELGAVPHIG